MVAFIAMTDGSDVNKGSSPLKAPNDQFHIGEWNCDIRTKR